MLNVANLDPGSFDSYSEDYIALLFQSIGTDRLTIEHKYLSTLVALPDATMNPILSKLSFMQAVRRGLNRTDFMELRQEVLHVIFRSLAELLRAAETAASTKSFIYRCINLFVSSLVSYDKQSIQIKYCINNHIAHSLISRSQTCDVLWAISSHHCLYQASNTSNNKIEYQSSVWGTSCMH